MSAAADMDLLAAELALGLLDPPEREEAQARLRRNPGFAAAHARWLALAETWDASAVPPPPGAWAAIEAALPANDTASSSVARWRLATLAASAAAVALAVVALERGPAPPAPVPASTATPAAERPLVAMLDGKQSGAIGIWVDPASGRLTSAATAFDRGKGSAELWVIPAGGKPRALGLVPERSGGVVAPPADTASLLRPGATLAVSLEPRGGSPTGQPTGPVVLTGTLAQS